MFFEYMFTLSRYLSIIFSVLVLFRCVRSMLSEKSEPEIWAYIRAGKDNIPVFHWENILGRARSADVRVFGKGIGRIHAILSRSNEGIWSVKDVFSKGGVWINGERVPSRGAFVQHGDIINLGGSCVRFLDISEEQRNRNELKRTSAGHDVSPRTTLGCLTVFQLSLLFQHYISDSGEHILLIAVAYITLILLEWTVYEAMRLMDKSGFEIEILAFYLTTCGLCVAAGSVPEEIYKQILLILVSVAVFLLCGWWLRDLKRARKMRIPIAMFSLGLLALNIFTSDTVNGAKSWLTVWGYTFQPSEFIKAFYIYVGAASLDALYEKNNLFIFTAFSAICVIALALMGDFGTALIFFVTFLVISFLRSGSLATIVLAVTGAGMAGVLAVSVKPYIAERFRTWGHAWEDVYDAGYQQTRAISAAASGGLVGKGAGDGWLKDIVYADTDMAFACVCEELGLIVALCMVLSVVLMAMFAVRSARNGRSAYTSIAACATSALLLVQLALNTFGSLDMLPFTGVTFPFVSRGGSSLVSCWMLMAYLKCADNRRDASFAVGRGELLDKKAALKKLRSEGWENDYSEAAPVRKKKKRRKLFGNPAKGSKRSERETGKRKMKKKNNTAFGRNAARLFRKTGKAGK